MTKQQVYKMIYSALETVCVLYGVKGLPVSVARQAYDDAVLLILDLPERPEIFP